MTAGRTLRKRGGWVVAIVASGLAAAAAIGLEAVSDRDKTTVDPFVGSFEVGSPGWQQFTGLQYESDRPSEDSFSLVDQPVRRGAKAARITVRHGYSRFGHGEDTSLVHFSGEKDGDELWYAFSSYFPSDWVQPYKWGIFAEWHANLDTSPIIAFNAAADSAELNVHTGLTDERANSFEQNLNLPLLDSLSKGTWNDFVMRVRWSKERAGEIEVWHKLAEQHHLRRLVSLAGIPTLQWTSAGKGYGVYLLFGLYRSSYCEKPTQLDCAATLGVQPTNTLYHDAYARAGSFEEVVKHAFPQPRPTLGSWRGER